MNALKFPLKMMSAERSLALPQWTYHAVSEQGVRENNEDRAGTLLLNSGSDILLYVADGAGGHLAGEKASYTAEQEIVEAIEQQQTPLTFSEFPLFLQGIFQAAQVKLQALDALPAMSGLGTTLTLLAAQRDQICVGHIGDTRVWLLRDGALHQLTQDHSDPMRPNRLLRALCAQPSAPDILSSFEGVPSSLAGTETGTMFRARRGDVFLVTSDGLHGVVPPHRMTALLRSAASPQEAAQRLVRCAHEGGSRDNISISIAAYGFYPRPVRSGAGNGARYAGVIGITLLLGIGLGLALRSPSPGVETTPKPVVQRSQTFAPLYPVQTVEADDMPGERKTKQKPETKVARAHGAAHKSATQNGTVKSRPAASQTVTPPNRPPLGD